MCGPAHSSVHSCPFRLRVTRRKPSARRSSWTVTATDSSPGLVDLSAIRVDPAKSEGVYQVQAVIKDFTSGETASQTVRFQVSGSARPWSYRRRITDRFSSGLKFERPGSEGPPVLATLMLALIQHDGSEFQPPAEDAEDRRESRHGFQGAHIGDRLDADSRVLVDNHVVDREARLGEQAEVDGAQLDLAAQRVFERRPDARREPVPAQVGRGDTGH